MTLLRGLEAIASSVDFDAWSNHPTSYGPLLVGRWFPAWWQLSPWASPFWTCEKSA